MNKIKKEIEMKWNDFRGQQLRMKTYNRDSSRTWTREVIAYMAVDHKGTWHPWEPFS
jgi:hypothetical protein